MKYIITTTRIINLSNKEMIKEEEIKLISTLKEWHYNIGYSPAYPGYIVIDISSINEVGWISKILEKPVIVEFIDGIIRLKVYDDWRE